MAYIFTTWQTSHPCKHNGEFHSRLYAPQFDLLTNWIVQPTGYTCLPWHQQRYNAHIWSLTNNVVVQFYFFLRIFWLGHSTKMMTCFQFAKIELSPNFVFSQLCSVIERTGVTINNHVLCLWKMRRKVFTPSPFSNRGISCSGHRILHTPPPPPHTHRLSSPHPKLHFSSISYNWQK